jgi:Ni/Co efflux regulator RcnB
MQRTLKATLAAALIAGAAGQALAQDHDHGDRGQQAPRAEAPRGAAPGGAPQQHAGPGPGGGGAPRGEAAPNFQRHDGAAPGGPGQQHFDRSDRQGAGPGAGGGAAAGAGRNFERDRGSREVVTPGAGRNFERDRGHEVVAPGGDRGFDNRRDGHEAGPGFDARNGRAGHPDNRGEAFRGDGVRGNGVRGDVRGGERWQPGRYPPVYWAHQRYHLGGYRQPYGFFVRSWAFGDILPRSWFARDYWIGDFYDYGLPYPPPGYTWVRVGGDALMIDQYTGRISQVVRGIFW